MIPRHSTNNHSFKIIKNLFGKIKSRMSIKDNAVWVIGEDPLAENGYDFKCIGIDILFSFLLKKFFFLSCRSSREVVLPA